MGDLNAHTGIGRKTNRAGTNLIEFIHSNGAVVLNEPRQPTSFWHNNVVESNSILDLFIGTELFFDRLLEYKVLTRSAESSLELFNKCLAEDALPMKWKESLIKMIEKKADDHSNPKLSAYFAITLCLCRLLERIVLQWLHDYLKEYNILIKNQSGFRAHRSTRDNLVFLIQKVKESFNRRRKSVQFFLTLKLPLTKFGTKA